MKKLLSDILHIKRRAVAVTAVILSICLLVGTAVPAKAILGGNQLPLIDFRSVEGWPADKAPGLDCVSAFAIEANTGTVVFSKDGERSMHPASITKVMTALVVIENCKNLDEMVSIEAKDVDYLEVGGNNWDMTWKGEQLPVRDCLYALLLESVNEVAMALARHVAGSVSEFCDMMNEKAASLGCTGTHFTNPHGLNDSAHVTTARDMVLIFRACLQNETFYQIDSTVKYKIEGTKLNPKGMTCYMHDRMMRSDSEYFNEYVKAGKTGYTSICGNTLLTMAEKDNQQLVICVLKGNSSANNYADTRNIMNYAFNNFTVYDMLPSTEKYVSEDLETRERIKLGVDGNANIYVPNELVNSVRMRYEPVENNQYQVGTIYYQIGDNILTTMRVLNLGPLDTPEEDESGNSDESAAANASDGKQNEGKGVPGWVKFMIGVAVVAVILYFAAIVLIRRRQRIERARRREHRRRREEEIRRRMDHTGGETGAASRAEGARHVSRAEGARLASRAEGVRHVSRAEGARHVSRAEGARNVSRAEGARHMSRAEGARRVSHSEGARHVSRARKPQK